jgi:hypothetical protein
MVRKYPAILALVAVVAGIAIADTFEILSWVYLFTSLMIVFVAVVLYLRGNQMAAGVIGLVSLMSLSAFGFSFRFKTYPPGHISHFADDGRSYTIFGTLDDWPAVREHQTTLVMTVDSLTFEVRTEKTK